MSQPAGTARGVLIVLCCSGWKAWRPCQDKAPMVAGTTLCSAWWEAGWFRARLEAAVAICLHRPHVPCVMPGINVLSQTSALILLPFCTLPNAAWQCLSSCTQRWCASACSMPATTSWVRTLAGRQAGSRSNASRQQLWFASKQHSMRLECLPCLPGWLH